MATGEGLHQDWLEQGLGGSIPIVYQSRQSSKGSISKKQALGGLRKVQRYFAGLMFVSAGAGAYLLATDGSLWHEAVSHAAGLIMIVLLDITLGYMNLSGSKRVYLPSVAAAVLAIGLQLGDITTAPQYRMTTVYFARYLFGLWAFDAILACQFLIIGIWAFKRSDVEFLARRSIGKELNYSRRSFMTTLVGFAALIGLGVALSSVKVPPPAQGQAATAAQGGGGGAQLPAGAVANANSMTVGSPVYFDYPSGAPNILFKRSDGSLAAYSMLCTHTCCQVSWYQSQQVFACPCHGSEYSSTGQVLRGPAYYPLPSISLTVDSSGNVYPTGVSGVNVCGV
ncbi:MAG: Rieske 2Fe-2S domain-containing protein [Nitrososphaerota archaeon]|nr:Rieske 2Fe-2S domain-containing protein [Nitrososphaerota archaeon]